MWKKFFAIVFVLSFMAAMPGQAADFPTKEVQIIIPWAAGGATDLIFRALAATTGKYLGKAVVV
jgi:tripartite-type tricarboxylate transporter receptor subunit TctC